MYRGRRKKRNIFKLLLFLLFLFVSFGVGYAYFSTSLNLSGTLIGGYGNQQIVYAAGHDNRVAVTQPTLTKWTSGSDYIYSFTFNVSNVGTKDFIGFNLELTSNQTITNIVTWNYDFNFTAYKVTVIGGSVALAVGTNKDVTVVIHSNSNNLSLLTMKVVAFEAGGGEEASSDDLEVTFVKNGGWGSNPYIIPFNVTVKNTGSQNISGWSFTIELPAGTTLDSSWSSTTEIDGNKLIVSSVDWNGKLNVNASTSFGVTFQSMTADYFPTIISRKVR